jgi:beta-glucuronidase
MIVEDKFVSEVDFLSLNQYYGLYGGKIDNIKNIHWEIDINKPVIISEFGVGALQGFHADNLRVWSEEHQELLYKETLPIFDKIANLAGITPWILTDFFRLEAYPFCIKMDGTEKDLSQKQAIEKKRFTLFKSFIKN